MAYGDDEVGADEDVQLAERDLLGLVQVTGGAQDDEEGVAVAVGLGPLGADDGVFERQLVQLELLAELDQLPLLRPVEPDPGHGVGHLLEAFEGVGERAGVVDPLAVLVDRVVDDGGTVGRLFCGSRVHRVFRRFLACVRAAPEPLHPGHETSTVVTMTDGTRRAAGWRGL